MYGKPWLNLKINHSHKIGRLYKNRRAILIWKCFHLSCLTDPQLVDIASYLGTLFIFNIEVKIMSVAWMFSKKLLKKWYRTCMGTHLQNILSILIQRRK